MKISFIPMDWESAIEHCKELKESNACGYSDWHLPTIDELKTIIIGRSFLK